MEEHANEFAALGVGKGNLGSHSACKGAATWVACGTTVSPHHIYLFAGWVESGEVKEWYFLYKKGGDQYLGHVVS